MKINKDLIKKLVASGMVLVTTMLPVSANAVAFYKDTNGKIYAIDDGKIEGLFFEKDSNNNVVGYHLPLGTLGKPSTGYVSLDGNPELHSIFPGTTNYSFSDLSFSRYKNIDVYYDENGTTFVFPAYGEENEFVSIYNSSLKASKKGEVITNPNTVSRPNVDKQSIIDKEIDNLATISYAISDYLNGCFTAAFVNEVHLENIAENNLDREVLLYLSDGINELVDTFKNDGGKAMVKAKLASLYERMERVNYNSWPGAKFYTKEGYFDLYGLITKYVVLQADELLYNIDYELTFKDIIYGEHTNISMRKSTREDFVKLVNDNLNLLDSSKPILINYYNIVDIDTLDEYYYDCDGIGYEFFRAFNNEEPLNYIDDINYENYFKEDYINYNTLKCICLLVNNVSDDINNNVDINKTKDDFAKLAAFYIDFVYNNKSLTLKGDNTVDVYYSSLNDEAKYFINCIGYGIINYVQFPEFSRNGKGLNDYTRMIKNDYFDIHQTMEDKLNTSELEYIKK